jgi:prepilin-type processing-associated H-X9-DG protein
MWVFLRDEPPSPRNPGTKAYAVNGHNTCVYSFHSGGANAAYGDGSVRFLSEDIDASAFAAALSRDGGEALTAE